MKPEQITAWALDEASAEERQQLEAALLENPQDKVKADETKAFCDFLLNELRDDSLALTDKQRERLVAQAGKPQAVEESSRVPAASGKPGKTTRWNIGVIVRLSLAACAVLGGFWTWLSYTAKQHELRAVAAVAEKPGIKVQLAPKPEAKKKAGQGPEARLLAAAPVKPAIVAEQPAAKTLAPMPKSEPAATVNALAVNKDQRAMTPSDVERLKRVQDENAYGLSFGGGLKVPEPVGLIVAGTGMTTQKVEPVSMGTSLVLTNGSAMVGAGATTQKMEPSAAGAALVLASGGALKGADNSIVQGDAGMVTFNGSGPVAAASALSVNSPRSLSMTPAAAALLRQTQERPAASLSLKAGFSPPQMAVNGLASAVMEIDGFINLNPSSLQAAWNNGLSVGPVSRPRVTPQKTGLVSCLLPGMGMLGSNDYRNVYGAALLVRPQMLGANGWPQMLGANGWPLMPQAQQGVMASSGDLDSAGTLADYHSSLAFGGIGLHNRGSTLMVLRTANASTGSIMVQSGAPLTITAFLPQHYWSSHALSSISSLEEKYFKGIGIGNLMYEGMPSQAYVDAKSPGVISFATTTRSHLLGSPSVGDTSASLAEDSGVSDLQAAVFNVTALSKSSSDAGPMLGSGALVLNGGVLTSSGKRPPLDLMGLPVVRTKSGTGATMTVAREFSYPGEFISAEDFIPRGSSFKFGRSSAATRADAPAAQAGMPADAGTLIANGNAAAASPSAAMGTVTLTGGTTVSNGAEPAMAIRDITRIGIREYMGSNRAAVGDATVAASNDAARGTNSLGNVVAATSLSASPASTLVLGSAGYSGYTTSSSGAMTVNGTVGPAPAQTNVLSFASAASSAPREGAAFGTTVSGSGGITKTGAGAMALTVASTYTGGTTASGGTLNVSNAVAMPFGDAFAPLDAPAAKPMVAGRAGSPKNPSAPAPGRDALGVTASVGYDSNYVWRGNSQGLQAGNGNLNASISPESAAPSVSFNNSSARNMGSLANGGGLSQPFGSVGGYGMNDTQQLTLGGSTNLGPPSRLDLNEAAQLAAAATGNPADAPVSAAPLAGNQWATTGNEFATFTTSAAGVQNPQAGVGMDLPGAKDAKKTDAFYFGYIAMPEEPKPAPQIQPSSGESYTRIIENEMKDVAREPLSTLSIDVDTASYANVRRFLNQNMIPPPDAVRIEELVNYFPTSEEGPAHDAKEPFGVRVELAPCPWQPVHRLARIAIKGREMDKNRKASNLVFLVDVSGSMNQQAKLPLVQQSLRMLTEQLGEGDRVTMVVYAGSSGVVLPPTSGEKKEEILGAINRLQAGGSTHGSAGIQLAYEQAVAGFIKGGVNRVILCTDGDFNVGTSSPEELEKLIKHKAKTGVFLSVLGFGSGNLKDRTMETLADKGNGNYAYIDSLSEARKVLVEQMGSTLETIAKDVKIQVEFNPAAVRSYRLIGYENRLLAKEDFNDDTKDAGEIGAGHSVVALYEVVPANLPAGAEGRPAVDSLKYQAPAISPAQLAEAAKSGELMTVKLRYKEPESDLSKLIEVPTKDEGKTLTASSEEFKFSAAVAGFGLLLRDSSYKGNLSWETVRRLALDGKGADKQGYRGEFLQLIDKARGLKETR